jgi:hypothetical protein
VDRIDKLKSISTIPADPEADIALINQYSVKELTPQDVFCFSIILCDNEVDRDIERFTNESLDKLAPMFLGKSVLFDHRWSAEKQVARLYRTFVEELSEKTQMGEPKRVLRGSAYMLRTEETAELIKAIEGGIKKEVSVSCSMKSCTCSICGEKFSYNWQTGKYLCENNHFKGDVYDGKMCVGDLKDPRDAYEVSFVAVPAQKGAGVTKGLDGEDGAFDRIEFLKTYDLSKISAEDKKEIIRLLQMSLSDDEERKERAKLLAENKKYLEGK